MLFPELMYFRRIDEKFCKYFKIMTKIVLSKIIKSH